MFPNLRPLALVATLCLALPAFAAGSSDESAAPTPDYTAAKAAVDAGDFATAIPVLTALTAAEPDNADAWNLLGYASRKTGAMDQAAVFYARALELNPDHLGALEYQGELYLETGQPDLARANLTRLQDLCGSCEEAEDLAQAVAEAGV